MVAVDVHVEPHIGIISVDRRPFAKFCPERVGNGILCLKGGIQGMGDT